jgi:hypothetical protein
MRFEKREQRSENRDQRKENGDMRGERKLAGDDAVVGGALHHVVAAEAVAIVGGFA